MSRQPIPSRLTRLAIAGYRSLRDVRVALSPLTVVTGPNGSGKSSVYRSLRLLAEIGQGRAVAMLAAEGGLPSTLWAGPEAFSRGMKSGELPVQGTRRQERVSLRLGFATEDFGYAIDLGIPPPGKTMFSQDPEIKVEAMWTGEVLGRSSVFAERKGPSVRVRDGEGNWRQVLTDLDSVDSMLMQAGDPRDAVELLRLREHLQSWRFYDHLRTDRDAPARRPQIGTFTPILDGEGASLAAAIQTIQEIGDGPAFDAAVADAFPGSLVSIIASDGQFQVTMKQPGLLRDLAAPELSDGTLRFLLLAAALLSPRPPPLFVLNEPETSLHPDLLGPLGRLIIASARRSQVIVVTHAAALVSALAGAPDCARVELEKKLGETIVSQEASPPSWTWPSR